MSKPHDLCWRIEFSTSLDPGRWRLSSFNHVLVADSEGRPESVMHTSAADCLARLEYGKLKSASWTLPITTHRLVNTCMHKEVYL